MEFIYFTLPDGKYLVMDNLGTRGEFQSNKFLTPTIFPCDTNIEILYHKIKTKVDIKAIQTKTFKM